MSRLIYEIKAPGCPFHEVIKHVFDDPPQPRGSAERVYEKRILIEATPEQITELSHDCTCTICLPRPAQNLR